MRGGNTEATLVVADGPVESPAHGRVGVVGDRDAPRLLEADTFAPLRPGSVVLVNSTVFEGAFDREPYVVVDIPATDLAVELGNIMTASMVMVGAYSAVTGLVALDALVDAVTGVAAAVPRAARRAQPGRAARRLRRGARRARRRVAERSKRREPR